MQVGTAADDRPMQAALASVPAPNRRLAWHGTTIWNLLRRRPIISQEVPFHKALEQHSYSDPDRTQRSMDAHRIFERGPNSLHDDRLLASSYCQHSTDPMVAGLGGRPGPARGRPYRALRGPPGVTRVSVRAHACLILQRTSPSS